MTENQCLLRDTNWEFQYYADKFQNFERLTWGLSFFSVTLQIRR